MQKPTSVVYMVRNSSIFHLYVEIQIQSDRINAAPTLYIHIQTHLQLNEIDKLECYVRFYQTLRIQFSDCQLLNEMNASFLTNRLHLQ